MSPAEEIAQACEKHAEFARETADRIIRLLHDAGLYHVVAQRVAPPVEAVTRAKVEGPQPTGCTWKGCGRPVKALGLCGGHYQRRKLGTPDMDAPIGEKLPRTVDEKAAAKAKSAPLPGIPVEVRHAHWEHGRLTACPGYNQCLAHVVRKGWEHWTCDACPGFGKKQRAPGAIHTHRGKLAREPR